MRNVCAASLSRGERARGITARVKAESGRLYIVLCAFRDGRGASRVSSKDVCWTDASWLYVLRFDCVYVFGFSASAKSCASVCVVCDQVDKLEDSRRIFRISSIHGGHKLLLDPECEEYFTMIQFLNRIAYCCRVVGSTTESAHVFTLEIIVVLGEFEVGST